MVEIEGGQEKEARHLHRHARPPGVHRHACPRREHDRRGRAGGVGGRRRAAADDRVDQPREGGRRADRRGAEQDRPPRRQRQTWCSASWPETGLNPVEWGGDTEVVRTSAVTGQGIKELIEILDYQSQLLELKADPTAPARGSVIEAQVDPGLGSVATVLVQDGTLKVGDVILSGPGFGRIRSLLNDQGKPISEAGPSTPVIVRGLNDLPSPATSSSSWTTSSRPAPIAEERSTMARQSQLAPAEPRHGATTCWRRCKAGDVKTINLIIKADVQGSVETLVKTVTGAEHRRGEGQGDPQRRRRDQRERRRAGDGDQGQADRQPRGDHRLPRRPRRRGPALAEQHHVEIKLYRVIYEIFDDLKKALSRHARAGNPREAARPLRGAAGLQGSASVGNIAGCLVTDGHIQRGSKIRLIRDGKVITEDLSIETLTRVKDDVKEVKSGFECGIKLAGYDDIKVGDRFEAYVREKHRADAVEAVSSRQLAVGRRLPTGT